MTDCIQCEFTVFCQSCLLCFTCFSIFLHEFFTSLKQTHAFVKQSRYTNNTFKTWTNTFWCCLWCFSPSIRPRPHWPEETDQLSSSVVINTHWFYNLYIFNIESWCLSNISADVKINCEKCRRSLFWGQFLGKKEQLTPPTHFLRFCVFPSLDRFNANLPGLKISALEISAFS